MSGWTSKKCQITLFLALSRRNRSVFKLSSPTKSGVVLAKTPKVGSVFFKLAVGFALVLAAPLWGMPNGMRKICGPLLARVSSDELTRLFSDNHGYASPAENQAFRDAADLGGSNQLYFHAENAVLKQLNDKGVRDKAVTGVLEALYTKSFFEVFQSAAEADPTLKYSAAYSDYKSVRVKMESSPELENKLRQLNQLVGRRFEERLAEYPELKKFIEASCADCGPIRHWHVAGVGANPQLAAARARVARELVHSATVAGDATTILYGAHEENGRLELGIEKVESSRASLQKTWTKMFGHQTDLLSAAGLRDSVAVPSREVIEIYRRFQGYEGEEFLDRMEAGVKNRFILEIAAPDRAAFRRSLADFRKYIEELDPYMPAIYEMKEILDLGHGRGDFDLVAVDLAGQNARNLHSAMMALSEGVRSPKKDGKLARVLDLTRRFQDVASEEFAERRNKFAVAVKGIDEKAEMIFSGDDGTYSPSRELTVAEKELILTRLAELGTPADYRLLFVRAKNSDTGLRIEPEKKAAFTTIAENIEKGLRKHLEGTVAFKELRNVLFAIEVVPSEKGYTYLNLTVAGRVPAMMEFRIKESFQKVIPAFLRMGPIKYIQPKHGAYFPVVFRLAA